MVPAFFVLFFMPISLVVFYVYISHSLTTYMFNTKMKYELFFHLFFTNEVCMYVN